VHKLIFIYRIYHAIIKIDRYIRTPQCISLITITVDIYLLSIYLFLRIYVNEVYLLFYPARTYYSPKVF